MDTIQTPTPQPTSNSTSQTDNKSVRPALLAIILPLVFVVLGAILGVSIYLFMQRRRSRRKAQVPGREAPSTSVGLAGTEEGLNEFGDAPPPYEMEEARKEHVVVEVETSSADAEHSGTGADVPEIPPPAYIAASAMARM